MHLFSASIRSDQHHPSKPKPVVTSDYLAVREWRFRSCWRGISTRCAVERETGSVVLRVEVRDPMDCEWGPLMDAVDASSIRLRSPSICRQDPWR
jgi:hypothetical protein